MEGDEIFASIDSLWFYSSVLLQPASKQKQSERPEELQPRQQQGSAGTHRTSNESSCQAPRCVKVVAVVVPSERTGAARSCREREERMAVWQREQRRRTRVVAVPARCSPAPMPPHDNGMAMKAHLRSWAHAVACSVR